MKFWSPPQTLPSRSSDEQFFFSAHPFRVLLLPSLLPRPPQPFPASASPFPAPPLRYSAKAERARQALHIHLRRGGAPGLAGALGGSGGRQARLSRQARSPRRAGGGRAGEGGRVSLLSVCEGGKERAGGRASSVPSACSTSQARRARRSAPRPRPSRAGSGPGHAAHRVLCVRRDLSEVTFSLQVDADFELHNFRALCELESGIPAAESQVRWAEIGASPRGASPPAPWGLPPSLCRW